MQTYILQGIAAVMSLLLLAGCGSADRSLRAGRTDVTEATEQRHVVAGYHPWWTRDAWRTYAPGLYDEIYFFAVEIDSMGGIAERNGWPDRWYEMQRSLGDAGVRVTPAATLFDQDTFVRLFRSSSSSARLEATLLNLLRDSPAAGGLHIDFEIYRPVSDTVRERFTRFIGDLRAGMDQLRDDLRLSVYLVAYDESDVFDEASLTEVVDYLVVQGYDLHARGEARTGPVAALEGWGRRNWRTIVARLVGLGVPPGKIVMSVPYYGYEWATVSEVPGAPTTGAGVTVAYSGVDSTLRAGWPPSAMERIEQYGRRRDDASGSPYYAYEDSSGWHQGWFEDPVSLAAKYRFVKEEGLRGVAVFPAAYGDETLEGTLIRAFRPGYARGGAR